MRALKRKLLVGAASATVLMGGGTIAAVAAGTDGTPGATTVASASTPTGPAPGEAGPITAPATIAPNAAIEQRLTSAAKTSRSSSSSDLISGSPELSGVKHGPLVERFGLDPTRAAATRIGSRTVSVVPGATGACVGTAGGEGTVFGCGDVNGVLRGDVMSAQLCVKGLNADAVVLAGVLPDGATEVRLKAGEATRTVPVTANAWAYNGTIPDTGAWVDKEGGSHVVSAPIPPRGQIDCSGFPGH